MGDNEFFVELLGNEWVVGVGPGGENQWSTAGKDIMGLTSDMALLEDAAYLAIVNEFAVNQTAFDLAFDKAWFDLTTTNVGGEWSSAAKCTDGSAPPARQMRTDEGPSVIV